MRSYTCCTSIHHPHLAFSPPSSSSSLHTDTTFSLVLHKLRKRDKLNMLRRHTTLLYLFVSCFIASKFVQKYSQQKERHTFFAHMSRRVRAHQLAYLLHHVTRVALTFKCFKGAIKKCLCCISVCVVCERVCCQFWLGCNMQDSRKYHHPTPQLHTHENLNSLLHNTR